MDRGYIKLWRKSLDSQVWKNTYLWQLWCYCLMRSNHKEMWVSVKTGRGETEVFLKPGQFIFGSKKAGKDLKQDWNTTYKRLMKLKKLQNVQTQSQTHYTIVSICNWEDYQMEMKSDSNPKSNPITNQLRTKSKPNQTDKNDKNVKNEKNSNGLPPKDVIEVIKYFKEKRIKCPETMAEKFFAHYELIGWVYGKGKVPIKNWKLCVKTWGFEKEHFPI